MARKMGCGGGKPAICLALIAAFFTLLWQASHGVGHVIVGKVSYLFRPCGRLEKRSNCSWLSPFEKLKVRDPEKRFIFAGRGCAGGTTKIPNPNLSQGIADSGKVIGPAKVGPDAKLQEAGVARPPILAREIGKATLEVAHYWYKGKWVLKRRWLANRPWPASQWRQTRSDWLRYRTGNISMGGAGRYGHPAISWRECISPVSQKGSMLRGPIAPSSFQSKSCSAQ